MTPVFGEGSEAQKEHLQGCSARLGWGKGRKLGQGPQ